MRQIVKVVKREILCKIQKFNLKKVNFTPIENEKVKSYFINSSQTLMRSFHFKNGENWIYQERLRTTQVRP